MRRTIAILALLTLLVPVLVFPNPAEATAYHAQGYYRLKDSAFVERDGIFHVFAIHECPVWTTVAQCDRTKRGFVHMTSTDLTHWNEVGYVIPPQSAPWHSEDVWAPTIVQRDGLYYMFYTAVEHLPSNQLKQTIALATSPDLMTWTDSLAPVFSCESLDWTYWDPNSTDGIGTDCRDPFVRWDDVGQRWVMIFSARTRDTGTVAPWMNHPMEIGAITSTDLATWTAGPELVNTKGWLAESSHIFEHNGLWYLVWTTNSGIRYATGPSILGPFTNAGPINLVSTNSFASEELDIDGHQFLSFVTSGPDVYEVRELTWNGTEPIAGEIQYARLKATVGIDDDRNGSLERTEPKLDHVPLKLYQDNGDGIFEPAVDLEYGTFETGVPPWGFQYENGVGQYHSILPGSYWVTVDAATFANNDRFFSYSPSSTAVLMTFSATQTATVDVVLQRSGNTWNIQQASLNGEARIVGGVVTLPADVNSVRSGMIESDSAKSCASPQKIFVINNDPVQNIRLTLSSDAGLSWKFWNGVSWVFSDGTVEQSSNVSDIVANFSTFPGGDVSWRVFLSAGFSQQPPIVSRIGIACGSTPTMPSTLAPSNESSVNNFTPTFQFSGSDPDNSLLSYELLIDTTPNFDSPQLRVVPLDPTVNGWSGMEPLSATYFEAGDVASYVPATRLPNGPNYWKVRTVDPFGSAQMSNYSVTSVVTTPPALIGSDPVATILSSTSVRVSWTTSNPGNSNIWYMNGDEWTLVDEASSTNHSFVLTGLTPESTYMYNIWTTDTYGQVTGSDDQFFTTPPTPVTSISSVSVSSITNSSATISWTTNENANSVVRFGTTTAYGFIASGETSSVTHTVRLNNLQPATRYHFQVQSVGSSLAQSVDFTFMTEDYVPIEIYYEPIAILRKPIRRR